jgi:hypothetical protein
MADERWPFDQAPNVAALSTVYVIRRDAPILLVAHYEDDHSWAFMDGGSNSIKNAVTVSMQHIVNIDPTVRDVADLAPGWEAKRDRVGAEWVRQPSPPDEDE